ncbi:helix-turn-helix domain-containing protein [Sphingomonas faeni]
MHISRSQYRRAAEKLGLSPSAMSRTLTRLRNATGDPLLV